MVLHGPLSNKETNYTLQLSLLFEIPTLYFKAFSSSNEVYDKSSIYSKAMRPIGASIVPAFFDVSTDQALQSLLS